MKRGLRICGYSLLLCVLARGLLTVTQGADVEAGRAGGGESFSGAPLQAAGPVAETAPKSAVPDERPGFGLDMLWAVIGIFFGGMALNLTPCVYPLIPVTISYFGAGNFGGSPKPGAGIVVHGLLYILGLTVMNSMLGVLAALSGRVLGMLLQHPVTLATVAAVLAIFALSMFGAWEFRLPAFITGAAARSYAGYFGSLFIGLTLGVVAAPCIGPFVVGVLVWIAGTGDPVLGFLIFFSLSLGMGVPLFALALLSGRLNSLPRSGEWMIWVRKLMGWVLVGMASFFVGPLLPEVAGVLLTAAVALSAGVHLGWVDPSTAQFRAFRYIKGGTGLLGIVLACWIGFTAFTLNTGVKWVPYSEKVLDEAKASGRPVIIDFYADWCSPCKRMDRLTFRDPGVMEAVAGDFIAIRVDITRGGEIAREKLMRQYRVRGVPTIVFLDPGGAENTDLRVTEFMPPEEFLARLRDVRKPGSETGAEGK